MARLFALIDQDEMIVYSEGFRREFVVYRSPKRKDFEDLKRATTLKPKGGPFLCACVDGPEIALLKKKKEIAAVWNHEGTAIGSSVWKGDWYNADSDRWLRWFDARGMTGARELESDRIRARLIWFGSGPWSGFPGYEEIAAKLLLQYPTAQLVAAVENENLTEEELEGAARILASWRPAKPFFVHPELRTVVPAKLRKTLLKHCLKSPDQDKRDRAQRAFGSDTASR